MYLYQICCVIVMCNGDSKRIINTVLIHAIFIVSAASDLW